MDELINEMYSTNADFKRYVDAYMKQERKDLETALSHAMVQNYADDILERDGQTEILPNLWKPVEDKGC